MTTIYRGLFVLAVPVLTSALLAAAARAQPVAFAPGDPPGAALFEERCATCHGDPDMPRAHSLEMLQTYSAADPELALTEGLMAPQGATLTRTQRRLIVDYLAREEDETWIAALMCAGNARTVDLSRPAHLSRFGIDADNSRRMTATEAGLQTQDLSDLELAWAIGFPGTGALRASPVMVGDTLFYAASGTRRVFALDAGSGCARWVFESPTPLRSSLTYGQLGPEGSPAILYGDAVGFVYALDAASGELLWRRDVRSHDRNLRLTGARVLAEDRIIVPISDSGVGEGANPEFECCAGHGAVTALRAEDGAILWEYHTMEEARYTGEVNELGVRLRGPSGAPIWSTPTVDLGRRLVYVTTGENTSHPATDTSDAVIALDLDSGAERWLFQALPLDVWNMACGRNRNQANCPDQHESVLKDYDFGGAAVLVSDASGDILLAGQKSGDLWALNPDDGTLLWNQRVGDGTALGGNHWGIASDGERAYLPINDPGVARPGFTPRPGMYSFFVRTGEPSWSHPLSPDCDDGRDERVNNCDTRYGLSATPLIVDGALISAGIDGRLFIFDRDDGRLLLTYDTVREYDTVNGVAARGGSIDSHSIAAGGGMLFVGSGYGRFNQTPGNVLLALRPRAAERP